MPEDSDRLNISSALNGLAGTTAAAVTAGHGWTKPLSWCANAGGTSFLSRAESSIGKECAANPPRSERRLDRPPQSRHSSPQPSPPRFPESAPASLSTSPSHRPCQTYIRTVSAVLPAAPHRLHTASASHLYRVLTMSSSRRVSSPPRIPHP